MHTVAHGLSSIAVLIKFGTCETLSDGMGHCLVLLDSASALHACPLGRTRAVCAAQVTRQRELPAWLTFPDFERVEWINAIVAQLWPHAAAAVVAQVQPETSRRSSSGRALSTF